METNSNKIKRKIELDILDTKLSLVTDDDEEYLKKLASKISNKVNSITLSGSGVSKNEALLFYTLELLDENLRLKLAIKNNEKA